MANQSSFMNAISAWCRRAQIPHRGGTSGTPRTCKGIFPAYSFSRDVRQFISAVTEKGAVVPERFGCCHGPDQACDVTASFVRRAFGRTTLCGVARIRQAVLDGATRADSFADDGMAGAENAWGASGGHVHGGAPPQL